MEEKVKDRLREIEHNAACVYTDVYLWDFFEQQMRPARMSFWWKLREFWRSLKPDYEYQRDKYTHPVK
jgi:hypothetical protein